jgi:predicted ArsR family transcriptional regulator
LSASSTRKLLWWLLLSTRGGPTRIKLLRAIIAKPLNASQLAKELGMDCTTIRHHLDILIKNHVIEAVGEKYGSVFYLNRWISQDNEYLQKILDEKGKTQITELSDSDP